MSKKIVEVSDKLTTQILAGLEEETKFSMTDVKAIILIAVTKGYEACLIDKDIKKAL